MSTSIGATLPAQPLPPSRAKAWLLASRPATLPAAAVPVLVGTAAAYSLARVFHPLVFAATLVSALLIQIGTNFANDYSDFHRGADHEGRLGPLRVTQAGLISPAEVRRGIVVAFGLAALVGAWLVYVGGWPILAIGIASIIAGLAYTGGPWPFGYYGLGDLFVFVFFGVIAVTGTAYLQMGEWSRTPAWLSIGVGLLVTNILVINNLRDLPTDSAAGKRTLAVRLGDRWTRVQFYLFALLAYAPPLWIALRYRAWWLLLPLVSLPLAMFLIERVHGGCAGRELNPMLKKSGLLLLVYGVLLSIALVVFPL